MPTTPNPSDCGQPTDTDDLWQRAQFTLQDIQRGFFVMGHAPPYLVAAADRISGIECPEIWTNAPNYWYYAWEVANRYFDDLSKVGMAVNAKGQRSYNQLHIHVDSIKPDVQNFLNQKDSQIETHLGKWSSSQFLIDVTVKGQKMPLNYRVLRLTVEETIGGGKQYLDVDRALAKYNPFQLLYQYVVNKDPSKMGNQTLVVVKRPKGGFYLFNSESSLNPGTGHGESLLENT